VPQVVWRETRQPNCGDSRVPDAPAPVPVPQRCALRGTEQQILRRLAGDLFSQLARLAVEPPEDRRPPLEQRILEVRRALARLQAKLRDRCPGDHEYVQHRDGKLPWCDGCGYTDTGLHRSEVGLG
jgi:hypothetical protein